MGYVSSFIFSVYEVLICRFVDVLSDDNDPIYLVFLQACEDLRHLPRLTLQY